MSQPVYDTIGGDYNATRRADPFLAGRISESLRGAESVLDLGCGTGNYTIAMARKGFTMTGVEPSALMLEKAKILTHKIQWINGLAERIPCRDKSFDGVFGTLTMHHWTDIGAAFIEIHRVLKPNGKAVFFTSTPRQMSGYWLNHYFPEMLGKSIRQMPSREKVETAAAHAGFLIKSHETYFIREDLEDHFLYAGKNKPALYFDEGVRAGISSFAALSNSSEVEKGLGRLNDDISSGAFEAVKKRYDNKEGDYLFLKFEKGT
jgi:ubiquinone/menaquinone biosynthesis C-methylase UbiE